AGRLKSENNILQMVLKHQQIIEMLTEENEKLRKILIEELEVSPRKLQVGRKIGAEFHSPCADCFECRRRRRKLR
ncbi:Transmembrane protein, partial [Thalictrum thalictroides]